MTVAVALGVMASALALYVAALSRRFARAPGWRDQRWFARAAACVAAYSALNVPIAACESIPAVVWCARAQIFFGALHVTCLMRYTGVFLGVSPGRACRAAVRACTVLGASALLPGLVYTGEVRARTFEPLHILYRDPITTPFGDAVFAFIVAMFVAMAVRYAGAWRRGVPHASTHFWAIAVLVVMVVNDTLTAAGVVVMPYLLDLAFVVPIGVVGYVLTARFVTDAKAHADLRAHLQSLVDARTSELARAHQALSRAEKLAALGQFAAGVAHEVNNPTAVVSANLEYLEEELGAERLPDDALECVRDSRRAAQRITGIVRQLLDAGRLAASRVETAPVSVAGAVCEALRIARARCPAPVDLLDAVAPDLHVSAQEAMLVQVLVNLVVNGAQAVPAARAGSVRVSAARDGERVRIAVADDGDGMPPEVLARVFEPFFSTKPVGVGTGLGLAVSRGLLASQGGDLAIESEPGRGTTAVVTLPAAEAPIESAAESAAPALALPPRLRVLVVDDDAALLASLRRRLDARYEMETADSVAAGIALACEPRFDLVLCDVMMPDGGGERLYRALAARSPDRAARVAFLTGGAASEAARAFLGAQPQPVLAKPLELAALDAVAGRLANARTARDAA